ncbi:nicotinate (nicotinamide) nucleotide adenylyltransferase [soil metagenome]
MKIGLFFGSFNPIHIGHLVLANYMLEFTELERIWFVISPHNPLKEKKTLLNDNHRLQLVRLAIGEHNKMKASNIEFKLPQPSYTVNTLAHLADKYPDHEFSLIMGMDNLSSFTKWKNYEYILEHHKIFVYPRPGYESGELRNHPSVRITEAPLLEISSSFLRNAIKEKKDVRFYFPLAVWEYLKEMHFYEK